MESLKEILELSTQGGWRVMTAMVLFLIVWGLKNIPFIKAKIAELGGATATKTMILFLAVAPAPAALLLTNASTIDIILTVVTSILMSGGLDAWLPEKKKE